jgi:hypothetical protein
MTDEALATADRASECVAPANVSRGKKNKKRQKEEVLDAD